MLMPLISRPTLTSFVLLQPRCMQTSHLSCRGHWTTFWAAWQADASPPLSWSSSIVSRPSCNRKRQTSWKKLCRSSITPLLCRQVSDTSYIGHKKMMASLFLPVCDMLSCPSLSTLASSCWDLSLQVTTCLRLSRLASYSMCSYIDRYCSPESTCPYLPSCTLTCTHLQSYSQSCPYDKSDTGDLRYE